MPDGLNTAAAATEQAASTRSVLVAFTTDADAEAALRKGLSEAVPGELDIRRVREHAKLWGFVAG